MTGQNNMPGRIDMPDQNSTGKIGISAISMSMMFIIGQEATGIAVTMMAVLDGGGS